LEKLSSAEIAHKRRYLLLLQKVQTGKTLTAAEIKQLEKYELMAKTKSTKKTKKTVKKKRTKRKPTAAQIKLLASQTQSIAEAEAQSGLNLTAMLKIKKNSKLKAAWDRGKLLKNLSALAETAVTIAEAEESLSIKPGQLEKLMETDAEIAEAWNQPRLKTIIEVKAAMVEEAKKGKPSAARHIEAILRKEIAIQQADFNHVTIGQLVELTGKSRQAVHDWTVKYGLVRNSDKTFSLAVFLRWFEDFTIRKVNNGSVRTETDPMKAAKVEKLEMELKRQRGQLLDRPSVMAGHLARYQMIVNALDNKADNLALACHEQKTEQIADTLSEFFAEIKQQLCDVPDELKLPVKAQKKFLELLQSLETK